MNKENPKSYYFQSGFFGCDNPQMIYEAFQKCMEILDVPVEVILIFDKNCPKGKIVFENISDKEKDDG